MNDTEKELMILRYRNTVSCWYVYVSEYSMESITL